MINADGDTGLRGKGDAAEKRQLSRAVLFGRDENIGAAVTENVGVELFDPSGELFARLGILAEIFCFP